MVDVRAWGYDALKAYLRIPSVAAEKRGIGEAVEFLKKLFVHAGFDVTTERAGGNPVIVARGGAGPRSILFYNHYDVQPADPVGEWRSPPFEPTERDGKLFARGVADNKANLIVRIAAVKALAKLPCRVTFVVEGEEELGSPTLAPFMKRRERDLRSDLCIWESSYRDEKGRQQLVLGCKGLVSGELVARGANTDLHSSRAVIAPNAAWTLTWALSTIKGPDERVRIRGFYDGVRRTSKADLKVLRAVPFEERTLLRQLGLKRFVAGARGEALKRRYFFEPTFNICGFGSGYTGPGHKTVLPREARVKFDVRLVPDMEPGDVIAKLRRHLAAHAPDVELAWARGYPPSRTPVDHPMVAVVRDAAVEAWGPDVVTYPLMPASGPMYLFSRTMPVVGIGVGHADSRIHAPNESIFVDDFAIGVTHVTRLLEKLGGR